MTVSAGRTTCARWPTGLFFAVLNLSFQPASAQFCDYFNYTLDPRQVVPATQVQGIGWSELTLCSDDSLRGYIYLNIVETVTAVHIHGPAEPNENADVLYELPLPFNNEFIPVLLGPVADDRREWLSFEKCYVDVHTLLHPDGAIRGRIHHEVAVTEETWAAVKCLYR